MTTPTVLKLVTVFSLLTAAPFAALAGEGGNGSGGGCTAYTQGQLQLLDFAVHGRPDVYGQGVQIPISVRAQQIGLDVLTPQTDPFAPVREFAKKAVQPWIASSPILAGYLSEAIATFPIVASPFIFNKVELTCPARGVTASIHPAILFTKDTGALLSVPTFNQLALVEQAGLLIHETLRMMQIQSQNKMTDADLQNITDAIFYVRAGSVNLDTMAAMSDIAEMSRKRSQIVDTVRKECRADIGLIPLASPSFCASITYENFSETAAKMMDAVQSELSTLLNNQQIDRAEKLEPISSRLTFFVIAKNRIEIDRLDNSPALAAASVSMSQAFGLSLFGGIEFEGRDRASASVRAKLIRAFRQVWEPGLASGVLSNPGGYKPSK